MILDFSCQKQVLTMDCPGRLVVADSKQQVYANFTLDDDWNGLTVVAIFSNAWETIRKEVLLTEMCVEIPTSVLTDPGFRVSLNGIGDGGNVLLSTKYMTKPISVHRAGSLVCLQAPDEDPELWQQALAAIGPLSNLDTEDKSSLVAAINEALKSGGTCQDQSYTPFYFTERKEFPDAVNVKSTDIYALYESLTPEWNELKDQSGNAVLKEYIFKTPGYNDYNPADYDPELRGEIDVNIKKPVFLVMAGIHGYERAGVLSLYRFFKDMANGKNVPDNLPEGAIFKVIPVANPFGFDNSKRVNENGVDLNRNFDYKWKKENAGTIYYSGDSKCSEPETQAITKWLDENDDAAVLLDIHNSSHPKEVAALIGLKTVSRAKRVALQGLDRVIPYWRNVIGYAEDSIFSYSSFVDANGGCVYYATDTLGIPGIAAEFSSMQNGSNETLSDETIAAGAEAIGNMLIEFFRETRTDQLKDLTNVAEVGA